MHLLYFFFTPKCHYYPCQKICFCGVKIYCRYTYKMSNQINRPLLITTRTKTSITYAKENDREKRERKKGRIKSKILVKSPKPRNKAQRKVDYKNYDAITIEQKLLQELISQYISSCEKCENYRDTGVSKNTIFWRNIFETGTKTPIDLHQVQ